MYIICICVWTWVQTGWALPCERACREAQGSASTIFLYRCPLEFLRKGFSLTWSTGFPLVWQASKPLGSTQVCYINTPISRLQKEAAIAVLHTGVKGQDSGPQVCCTGKPFPTEHLPTPLKVFLFKYVFVSYHKWGESGENIRDNFFIVRRYTAEVADTCS